MPDERRPSSKKGKVAVTAGPRLNNHMLQLEGESVLRIYRNQIIIIDPADDSHKSYSMNVNEAQLIKTHLEIFIKENTRR